MSTILGCDAMVEYDFVIVGGGNAGCVVANRLSENPKFNVLVIEAGPRFRASYEGVLDAQVPGFLPALLQNSTYDYNYTSVAQSQLNDRRLGLPRARLLGGSSSHNGMLYTRGSSSDYDRWAAVTGDAGWSWKKLLPYIFRNEKWVKPNRDIDIEGMYDPRSHSYKGMTFVSLPSFPDAIDAKVEQAARELGGEWSWNVDTNSGDSLGVGWGQYTIGNGERSSAAAAYLSQKYVKRKNLHVLVNHRVTKVTPASGGATTPVQKVTARKEVILSAGAFGTPQILLLSGIGDTAELNEVGIEPKVHLPSVGKNLTEQPLLPLIWQLGINGTFDTCAGPFPHLCLDFDRLPDPALRTQTEWFREWKTSRTGPLTFLNVNTVAWTRLPDDSPVYAQYPDPSSGRNTPQLEIQFVGTGLYPTPGPNILLAAVLVTPGFESRGSVKLNSTNIYDSPLIDLGLMKSGFDWYGLREAVRASRRFFAAPAWQDYQLTLLPPFDTDNDEQLDEGIRDLVTGALHPVGSASMSPKGAQWGVVDPDLRVKKVRGLRIVDASVMPYITSGHTQAPVYAIAERAADLIKQYWA
ncbi:aryl-alcohol oxidase [Coprinopsis cinerea okayama7|uniref:pyranose dehydrogenase (acceptor) n=1 Tax=Coprinopsis cinerea (strain Okayama-7 / 130 / ATCC MYA-4618 / FGSC 9003) TaxID=240176 RepID=A8NM83_COPC7|nr:aryl-alcohol oxidase [Coprinopsis cinerea okayama7\|eukprot:XP_001834862.2 aryl-alcohol oxidase [Coprinopsis cinerea okayama7\